MGTHISRVKSVDLDSWTDEQLQSVLNWGNARANKYWEAKLAPGHVPSEAKIENFIRTKYELKRWVMDGPMPDPSTLDADADDDVPLSVVKEKQIVDKRESIRKASVGQSSAVPRPVAAPQVDLIGGDLASTPPPRASTAGPTATKVPPKGDLAPPKATNTKDSLLGLDFLGTQPTAPPRPASTTGTPSTGGQSRPDLKQSILSLYATAPRPQQPTAPQHASQGSFGGMPSHAGMAQTQNSSFGGLNDAFSSLSFGGSPAAAPKPAQVDAFASLGSFTSSRPAAQSNNSSSAFSGLSGGSFFDSKPATSSHQQKSSIGSSSAWGSAASPALSSKPTAAPASSALGALFDFGAPAPVQSTPSPKPMVAPTTTTTTASTSVFNLNQAKPAPALAQAATMSASNPLSSFGGSNLSGADVWGGNAWAAAEPAKAEPAKPAATTATNDFGWGSSFSSQPIVPSASGGFTTSFASQPIVPSASGGFAPAPKVSADEEFGGWTSSTTATNTSSSTSKPAVPGMGGEDLFSNVWQ